MRFKTFISQKTQQAKCGIQKVSSTVKLYGAKSALNEELSEMYDTLGKIRYDELIGKGDNSEYALKIVDEITRIKSELEGIEAELRSLNGRHICISCGKESPKNVAFCPYCGEKIASDLSVPSEEDDSPADADASDAPNADVSPDSDSEEE